MENLENLQPQSPTPAAAEDLRGEVNALRQLVFSLLVLTVVVSGTLLVFLWRQYRLVSSDLTVLRPQLTQMVTEYEKNRAPAIKQFVDNLTVFSRTHPDFTPVLLRYGIRPTNAPTALAPTAAAPAKSTTAPPAKK